MTAGDNSTSQDAPYREELGDRLVLRSAVDQGDIERVAAFSGAMHGHDVDVMTRRLFQFYPELQPRDLLFVEERGRSGRPGRVVSTLCLIPWTIRYEGVALPVGEMGMVGTLEEYRRRGLIRAQVRVFERRLDHRGCLVSVIQGIRYFYRQFGYEYALPLEPRILLELRSIPPASESGDTHRCRHVAESDLPVLKRLYDDAVRDLAIWAPRDEDIWRYLLRHSANTSTDCERWLIESPQGGPVGYFGLAQYPVFDADLLVVGEASRLGHDAALAALRQLKALALERGKLGIRLNLPANSTLVQLARALKAHELDPYAWQIRLPSPAALLSALAPVLERRLAASPFAGLTQDVRISLYRRALLLRFEDGHVVTAADLEPTDEEPVRVPPPQLTQLVLGHRTLQELHQNYPDAYANPEIAALIDVLFPRVRAFLYTPY